MQFFKIFQIIINFLDDAMQENSRTISSIEVDKLAQGTWFLIGL